MGDLVLQLLDGQKRIQETSCCVFRRLSVSDSISVIVSSCSESTENQTARRSSDFFLDCVRDVYVTARHADRQWI